MTRDASVFVQLIDVLKFLWPWFLAAACVALGWILRARREVGAAVQYCDGCGIAIGVEFDDGTTVLRPGAQSVSAPWAVDLCWACRTNGPRTAGR